VRWRSPTLVHETGRREAIGLDIGEIDAELFWVEFLRSLRAPQAAGVRFCVSDQHQGPKNASPPGRLPWQRCTLHYAGSLVMPMGVRPAACSGHGAVA